MHEFESTVGIVPQRSVGAMPTKNLYDPQVKPQKRRFTEAFKRKIIQELDNCTVRGQAGLILRREGLYSSQVTNWRKKMAGKPKSQSSKKSNDLKNSLAKANRRIKSLEIKIEQKDMLLDLQKKMAEFAQSLENKNTSDDPLNSSANTEDV
jgi:transposase